MAGDLDVSHGWPREYMVERHGLAEACVIPEMAPAPRGCHMCTGPTRQTVDMVCPNCGTNYGTEEELLHNGHWPERALGDTETLIDVTTHLDLMTATHTLDVYMRQASVREADLLVRALVDFSLYPELTEGERDYLWHLINPLREAMKNVV